MGIATLTDIIQKIRKLTVTTNSSQLTDGQIIDYINSYYLYDFPAQFRSLKLKDTYTFNTVRGIDTYPFDSEHYSTVEMPVFCQKRYIPLYQNPSGFFGLNFNWQFQQTLTQGNGTTGVISGVITNITQATNAVVTSAAHGLSSGMSIIVNNVIGMTEVNGVQFSVTVINANSFFLNINSTAYGAYGGGGTWTGSYYEGILTNTPLIRSINNNPMVQTTLSNTNNFLNNPTQPTFQNSNISRVQNILITVNIANGTTLNVTDDGNGNLIGNCTSGTINYDNGQIANLNFSQAVPSGQNIVVQYNPVTLNIPLSIMFYQNQFTLRPVPDKGYTIELVAYRLPSQALLGTTSTSAPNMQGVPEQKEWWEVLCFGCAKKIYQDRIDLDGVAMMDNWLQEAMSNAQTRTYAQLGKQSIVTIFSGQIASNYTSGTGWGVGAGQ